MKENRWQRQKTEFEKMGIIEVGRRNAEVGKERSWEGEKMGR
jgi:hypothetical protein